MIKTDLTTFLVVTALLASSAHSQALRDDAATVRENETAQPWGDLVGRFVLRGEPPKSTARKSATSPTGVRIPDESLQVNALSGGVANVVVYLLADSDKLQVHPAYQADANAKIELRMEDWQFKPHVLLMRTSQTMVQRNADPDGHNANIAFLKNDPL